MAGGFDCELAELVPGQRIVFRLGAGKRHFPASGTLRRLSLSDSQVTTTGAILASYTRT